MRRGCCFELIPKSVIETDRLASRQRTPEEVRWPIIAPSMQLYPSSEGYTRSHFSCFRRELFDTIKTMPLGSIWLGGPLTTLISQLRQFEVCYRSPNVAFLPSLLGAGRGSHIRFHESSEDEESDDDETGSVARFECKTAEHAASNSDSACSLSKSTTRKFNLPTLNPTQQRGVEEFISSPTSTLSLVQVSMRSSTLLMNFMFSASLNVTLQAAADISPQFVMHQFFRTNSRALQDQARRHFWFHYFSIVCSRLVWKVADRRSESWSVLLRIK